MRHDDASGAKVGVRLQYTRNRRCRCAKIFSWIACIAILWHWTITRNARSTGRCPTVDDIVTSGDTKSVRRKIWGEPSCSSGCTVPLRRCASGELPCCVVTKRDGLFKRAVLKCSRLVDNALLAKIDETNFEQMLRYCESYLALDFMHPNCSNREQKVPRTLYTMSADETAPLNIQAVLRTNPSFSGFHFDDGAGYDFIKTHCGVDVAEAFSCIKPPAFRADLFRFCALYALGGVYLDADMVLLRPLTEVFSPCSAFTLGYDQAQGVLHIDHVGMQMKILASEPRHDIPLCMLRHIIEHVKSRKHFKRRTFEFSGPQLLRKCYLQHPTDVAITYMDTRGADWPYTGLRAGSTIYAYEIPSPNRHFEEIIERDPSKEYNDMVKTNKLYTSECKL